MPIPIKRRCFSFFFGLIAMCLAMALPLRAEETAPPSRNEAQSNSASSAEVERLRAENARLLRNLDEIRQLLNRQHREALGRQSSIPLANTSPSGSAHEIRQMVAHRGAVRSVAISPDGRWGASGGDDGYVRVWELATGKEVFSKKNNERGGQILAVALSADGKFVAAGGVPNGATIWRIDSGEIEASLETTEFVQALAFAPDSSRLMIGSGSQVISWTGKDRPRKTFDVRMDFIRSLAFSSDGRFGVCAGGFYNNGKTRVDSFVRVWDLETEKVLFRVDWPVRTVFSGALLTPDNRQVVTAGPDGRIRLWDVESGNELHKFQPIGGANSLALSGDGQRAAAGGFDSVTVWDVPGQKLLHRFPLTGTDAASVAMTRDARLILSSGRDGIVRLWKVPELLGTDKAAPAALNSDPSRAVVPSLKCEVRRYEGHKEVVYSVAVTPDGKQIISSSFDLSVRLWDLATGRQLQKHAGDRAVDIVNSIRLSPDGKLAIFGAGQYRGTQRITLWDLAEWKSVKQWPGHDHLVTSVAFSPDGRFIVSGGADATARLWNLQTGQEVHRFGAHVNTVTSVGYSSDGRRIVTGSIDGSVRLWDPETGKEIHSFTDLGEIQSVAFSADGKRVAAAGNQLSLWDTESGRKQRGWEHGRPISCTSISFSPDGRLLASGGRDKVIRLWNVDSGAESGRLEGHDAAITEVAFTPNGKNIVSASYDRTIRLWNLPEPATVPRREPTSSSELAPQTPTPASDALVPAIKLEGLNSYGGGAKVGLVRGWEFDVQSPVVVKELGVWDVDKKGLDGEFPIGIWDAEGKLLVSATVPQGNETRLVDNFRYVKIDPVSLKPGKRYVIGARYPAGTKEFAVGGGSGNAFSSIGPIRWVESRHLVSEELALPTPNPSLPHKMPGNFGPNFLIDADETVSKAVRTYYRTREAPPVLRFETIGIPEKPDGSHREELKHTVSLFASPNGELRQIVIDDVPLGTGDQALARLASEIKQRSPPQQGDRASVRIAAMSAVRANDLQNVMEVASWGRFEPFTKHRPAIGGEFLTFSAARPKQAERDGKFVDPERFRDLGDCIEDRWTGLLWQKDGTASGKKNFYEAAEYAKQLELGELKNWRVPTIEELATIFPATFAPFENTKYTPKECCQGPDEFASYWTSELDVRAKDYAYVYHWYAKGGANNGYASRNAVYVRCVHDPINEDSVQK